jgi:hypothetical protein
LVFLIDLFFFQKKNSIFFSIKYFKKYLRENADRKVTILWALMHFFGIFDRFCSGQCFPLFSSASKKGQVVAIFST